MCHMWTSTYADLRLRTPRRRAKGHVGSSVRARILVEIFEEGRRGGCSNALCRVSWCVLVPSVLDLDLPVVSPRVRSCISCGGGCCCVNIIYTLKPAWVVLVLYWLFIVYCVAGCVLQCVGAIMQPAMHYLAGAEHPPGGIPGSQGRPPSRGTKRYQTLSCVICGRHAFSSAAGFLPLSLLLLLLLLLP